MGSKFWAGDRRRRDFTVDPLGGTLFRGGTAIGAPPTGS